MARIRVAACQINTVVGDLGGNVARIAGALAEADAARCDVAVFPELTVTGYPPEDLLLRPAFIQSAMTRTRALAEHTTGMTVVVGTVDRDADLYNAAAVFHDGRFVTCARKRHLPNYGVFDEKRVFAPGTAPEPVTFRGVRIGVPVCEDIWGPEPVECIYETGGEILLVPNGSPYWRDKTEHRLNIAVSRVVESGLPLVYLNMVGGQDELVFDGASFALDAGGRVAVQLPLFEETLGYVEVRNGALEPGVVAPEQPVEADVYRALCLGVRDYIVKNGFPGALLGLSGGIDSALVLAIAVDALGADKVRSVMMPSPYTADISWIDARDMAKRVGVRYDEISIVPEFEAFKKSLAFEFEGLAEDATEENIQARIRGTLLMALSNKTGAIVLTTGNKSEMSTGYCTLYGDMAGGFAVLKDVAKTMVFKLARWRNAHDPYGTGANPIPERIITRPPSAELRPDQKDQDSLPPYEVLDEIVSRYMEEDQSAAEIVAAGFDPAAVEKVTRLIRINEYKRRQSPVGIRVTHRSFGKDWRYPITSLFRA